MTDTPTPPWVIPPGWTVLHKDYALIVQDSTGADVCLVPLPATATGQQKAAAMETATLLSAAPEMLAALEAAAEHEAHQQDCILRLNRIECPLCVQGLCNMLRRRNIALIKAKGE